ncbi:unnamed protein product [Nyctereutes procyonoides]|uniref:Hexosyltransferase n=1 Tax=Nyctereutes procyonoides TaxID=34880 RepID=A0A811ZGV2_NYCPR|nr:unnamed protein product [Nyctereutes procyonoides]
MAVRSRRPWMSVALGLVLGFTAASWLIAPRVAELSERKRRGSSLCSYYGRSAAGPGAGAQQPLPQPQPRPRPEQSAPPARPELPGPPLPEAAPGATSFRSSPWQQPAPLQQRRRGREPEGATGLPGARVAEGDPEEEDGGAAGQRRSGRPGSNHNGSGDGGAAAPSSRPRDFLYVGVMTAQKYLGSRALAAQRTWARFIPGRVEFFSSEQSPNAGASQPPPPLPVIALPGVDDSYPPQKKSFMMIKYMHDHYLDKYEWFMRADDDVYIKAITLHPNKRPAYQYRLHNYMLSRKISELRYRTIQLHRESALMSKLSNSEVSKEDQQLGVMPSFNHFQPRDRDEVIEWEFLMGKLLYSASENQPPRQNINSILRTALDDTVLQVMEMINENAKSRGRLIDFKEIQYGYRRVDPMHGVEYILDLLLLYKRHKGRKLTVPVRRHAYLQQLFSKPFFRETEELDVNSLVESINSDTQSFSFISNSLKILSSFQGAKEMEGHHEKKIHILVPLVGRYDIFLRFMDNFEKTCLIPKQNVKLVITLFSRDSGQDSNKHIELIKEYQNRYPNAEMTLIPMKGEFSRGLGLEMASSQFDNDTLLLFCDVDLIFRGDFLQRCRDNTIQGQQVYYPIIFSQYDPKVTNGGNPPTDDDFVFSKKTGFWRDYGYGITCIYKSDLLGAGGFDTSIQGWGLEDVDLYNKVILSGLRPFRSQEVGVVHIFHPVHCDPNLDPKQYKMCLGSKASTFASTMQLAELWLEKHLGVRYNRTLS